MGLAETFALLREHGSLADVLRALEARGPSEAEPRLLPHVVILSEERARRRRGAADVRRDL